MKLKIIYFVLIFFGIWGCSSVKETAKSNTSTSKENVIAYKMPGIKAGLYELEFNAKITAGISGSLQTVNAKIRIAGTDSIQMNITGPFGIAIGKFYANKDEFQFYSIFENITYIGKPDAESLKRILNMDISFDDFIRIIRGEPLFEVDSYRFVKIINDNNHLWISKQADFGDFIVSDVQYNTISTYQRKVKDDALIADIKLTKFLNYNNYFLSNEINCSFPANNSSIKLELSDIKINNKFDSQFKFPIVKSSKIININE